MLGNEGAYLPGDGNGGIPKKYWNAVNASVEILKKEGLLNEKDKENFLNGMRSRLTPNTTLPLSETISSGELIDKYLEASKKPVEHEGLYTGLYSLDKMLLGIQEQNFMVICARTGVGKTLVANYMVGKFAEQGQKILYLALEESEQEVGDRWAKVVMNNNLQVPPDSVDFLYAETVSFIKEDKYNIIPLIAAASQLGYTMICVDMLNNLIDTVRDENSNVFLNRIIDQTHKCNMTLLMTARLRQPLTDQEKDFPSMESVYGRVDLGYIVSKCIGVTALPDEGDGKTRLRLHILKNRRKRIGMKMTYPRISVTNLLELHDEGDDSGAAEQLQDYENNVSRTKNYHPVKQPKGDTDGADEAF